MATREEWQGRVGKEWARKGDALDVLLAPAGRAGLAALAPQPGWRILDLGCGGGATTADLAEAVGPEGHVTGLDVSPDLAARARERLAGRVNVDVIEADAETHDFTDCYDALFSRFGAMFFDDPPAGYANLHAALKPDAPVAIVAWREMARNQWAAVPMTFVAEVMPAAPMMGQPGPGPFAWADPGVFRPLLEGAGFRDVAQQKHDFAAEITDGDDADPVERAVSFMMRVGPLASRLRNASEAQQAEARAFLRRRLAKHVIDGAVRLEASAWMITARA